MAHPLDPLRKLYEFLTAAERTFFRRFSFLTGKPRAKVVSVGNLTMGGTGKTPVLMQLLEEMGPEKRCVVVSRGYRSAWERGFYLLRGRGPHPHGLTDEALLVNARFPDVPVLLGKNRFHSCVFAERAFSPGVILLDDGFQYRRVRKDVELVLWDTLQDPAQSEVLPVGNLREPLERALDASAILLTRCELAGEAMIRERKRFFSSLAPGVPLVELKTEVSGLIGPYGGMISKGKFTGDCIAFAAIGNFSSFRRQLEGIGIRVVKAFPFRDHHFFSSEDLDRLGTEAGRAGLKLVCTEKDRAKIPPVFLEKMGILSLAIKMIPVESGTLSGVLRRAGLIIP